MYMKKNNISHFDFVDYLDIPAVVIDSRNGVCKTNDKFINKNTSLNFFNINDNNTLNPNQQQIETSDWQLQLSQCFNNGNSEFNIKQMHFKGSILRLSINENKFALVCLREEMHEASMCKSPTYLFNDPHFKIKELLDLASHTAHAINNPLTVILTRSQMLKQLFDTQKPVTNEMTAIYLDKVSHQSDRIKKIVDGMRVLTKTPPPEEHVILSLASVIDEAYVNVSEAINSKGIKFVFNYDQKDRFIKCKQSELIQLFTNLFNNSIHELANTESPRIEINFEESENHIHFYFSDNGPGVKAENEAKIFTAFFTTKQVGANIGLGLNVSRKYARLYGGDLEFDKSRGLSCFHISLSKEFITQENNSNLQEYKKIS